MAFYRLSVFGNPSLIRISYPFLAIHNYLATHSYFHSKGCWIPPRSCASPRLQAWYQWWWGLERNIKMKMIQLSVSLWSLGYFHKRTILDTYRNSYKHLILLTLFLEMTPQAPLPENRLACYLCFPRFKLTELIPGVFLSPNFPPPPPAGLMPLHVACQVGATDSVRLLIEHGKNHPNCVGFTVTRVVLYTYILHIQGII